MGKLTLTFKELEQGEIPHGVGVRWRLDVGSRLLVVRSVLHREEPDERFWSANDRSLTAEGPKTEFIFLSFILMKLAGRHSFQQKKYFIQTDNILSSVSWFVSGNEPNPFASCRLLSWF